MDDFSTRLELVMNVLMGCSNEAVLRRLKGAKKRPPTGERRKRRKSGGEEEEDATLTPPASPAVAEKALREMGKKASKEEMKAIMWALVNDYLSPSRPPATRMRALEVADDFFRKSAVFRKLLCDEDALVMTKFLEELLERAPSQQQQQQRRSGSATGEETVELVKAARRFAATWRDAHVSRYPRLEFICQAIQKYCRDHNLDAVPARRVVDLEQESRMLLLRGEVEEVTRGFESEEASNNATSTRNGRAVREVLDETRAVLRELHNVIEATLPLAVSSSATTAPPPVDDDDIEWESTSGDEDEEEAEKQETTGRLTHHLPSNFSLRVSFGGNDAIPLTTMPSLPPDVADCVKGNLKVLRKRLVPRIARWEEAVRNFLSQPNNNATTTTGRRRVENALIEIQTLRREVNEVMEQCNRLFVTVR